MKIPAHTKLLMIGDSITDVERKQPVGEGLWGGLGKGYVALVDALLQSTYPERQIRVVNMGCSGNNVLSLRDRWQRDVLDLKPDWVSICIGINDVWRQYDEPFMTEGHVPLPLYQETLQHLVAQTLPHVKQLVLFTPYFIEPNKKDLMRASIDKYGAVVKKLAAKHNLICVDLQAALDPILAQFHSSYLSWDRVHPSAVGHMAFAKAFLNAVDFNWNGGKK